MFGMLIAWKQYNKKDNMRDNFYSGYWFILEIIILIIISIFLSSLVYAEQDNVKNIETYINKTYEQIMFIPDVEHNIDWILENKYGDCSDFAKLTKHYLKEIGIESNILVLEYRGLKKIKHAICLFKEDNFYSYFSNGKLHRTNNISVEQLIKGYCPEVIKYYELK